MEMQKKLIRKLVDVAQLDVDAWHAYDQAIQRIGLEDVKAELRRYQKDHERHVAELSEMILNLGGDPPAFERDLKGYLIVGMTVFRGLSGTEGALKAMRMNELLTNRTYDDLMKMELPEGLLEIVMRARDDERHHLEYIEGCIEEQVWQRERGGMHMPSPG